MFEPSDGWIWIMKYTFSGLIRSALAIPDIDKMLLAVYLIIILVWSLVFFHKKVDRPLEHVGLSHIVQSRYFTREHLVIRMLNLPSDILHIAVFWIIKRLIINICSHNFEENTNANAQGMCIENLNNFCHLNTLLNAWPQVLFATIAMSSWRRSQSLTRPAWGMTVNVNFSDYFFSRYSNKDEQINDTAYFYKIWCYKQHKLLHLSMYIWQASGD